MPLFYITGISGTGKSAVLDELQSRGFEAHGVDEHGMPEGVNPSFELALPADFVEQCKSADVIYFHGGDTHLLHFWMGQFDMPAIFGSKVVGTSSADYKKLVKPVMAEIV